MTMIPCGSNGKMKGTWIVTELIGKKLITVPEDGLTYDGLKHHIVRLSFSEEVRKDTEIAANFAACTGQFLGLFRHAEQVEKLCIPAGGIAAEIWNRADEPFTGGCFLSLFAEGFLKLSAEEDQVTLLLTEKARPYAEIFEDKLQTLGETLVSYSGDNETVIRTGIEENGAEEAPETVREPETQPFLSGGFSVDYADEIGTPRKNYAADAEAVGEDFSVSYETQENGFSVSDLSGLSAEEVSDLYGRKVADERMLHIRNNISSTLTSLKKMMDDIDDERSAKTNGLERYRPSFVSNRVLKREGYSIRIPDDFSLRENADGYDFILWLPNGDNPEEWEASLFALLPDGMSAGRFFSGKLYTEYAAKGNTEHRVFLNAENGVFRFRVTAPISREELTEILMDLFTEEAINV